MSFDNPSRVFSTYVYLAKRSITDFTRGSFLGVLWSVVLPLLHGVTVLWVFSELYERPGVELLFFMWPALFTWQFFVKTTTFTCRSLGKDNVKLSALPNIYFSLSHLFNDVLSFAVMIAIVIGAKVVMNAEVPIIFLLNLIPAFGLVLLFTMGIGLLLSAFFIFVPDVEYLWGVLCQIGMFLSPIYFPEEFFINGRFWSVLQWNPMFYLLRLVRESLVTGEFASLDLWLLCSAISFSTAYIGVYVYRRLSKHFINFI